MGSPARLADLRAKLAVRTQGGSPKPGFKVNVRQLRAEIARLEKETSR